MKAYLVGYSRVGCDDLCYIDVFTTNKESTAIDWCYKFNRKIEAWKEYFKTQTTNIACHHVNNQPKFIQNRYWDIIEINNAYYKEIEFRE